MRIEFSFISVCCPASQAEPHLPEMRMDTKPVGDIFQRRQRGGPIGILNGFIAARFHRLMGLGMHQGGLAGKGIELLGEAESIFSNTADQLSPSRVTNV